MQEQRALIHDWPLVEDKALNGQRVNPSKAEERVIHSYSGVAIAQPLHSPPHPSSMLLHSRTEFAPLAGLHLHKHD